MPTPTPDEKINAMRLKLKTAIDKQLAARQLAHETEESEMRRLEGLETARRQKIERDETARREIEAAAEAAEREKMAAKGEAERRRIAEQEAGRRTRRLNSETTLIRALGTKVDAVFADLGMIQVGGGKYGQS